MSFVKTSLLDNTKKLYRYKTRSFIWVLASLMIIQILGMAFSLLPTTSYSSSDGLISLSVSLFSANPVFVFTMFWIFLVSVQITATLYRENEFMFVLTKTSNLLSDLLIILTLSGIGVVTTFFADIFLRNIHYYLLGVTGTYLTDVNLIFTDYVKGIVAMYLIIALLGFLAYLFGLLVQLNRMFMVIIPTILIAVAMLGEQISQVLHIEHPVMATFTFYFMESSILIFIMKYLLTMLICFALAFAVSKRLEVRK